jgi:hypothetical protein
MPFDNVPMVSDPVIEVLEETHKFLKKTEWIQYEAISFDRNNNEIGPA